MHDSIVVTYARSIKWVGCANRGSVAAMGPYEVSVSQSRIIVHHAVLASAEEFYEFQHALGFAHLQFIAFFQARAKGREPKVLEQCEVFEIPGG